MTFPQHNSLKTEISFKFGKLDCTLSLLINYEGNKLSVALKREINRFFVTI